MSQITLQKSPKPDNKLLAVGGDAKNTLPTKVRGNFSCMDVAGLSWIFLEDPWNVEITHKPDEMECDRI